MTYYLTQSLDLPLSVISYDPFISIDSYAFILFPLSPTPYPYDWSYTILPL